MNKGADRLWVISWIADPEGRRTHMDALWREFTGQSEAQTLGFGWLDAVHPDDRAKSQAAFDDAAFRLSAFRVEHRLRRADGAHRLALTAGSPRFDASGALTGWIGSIVDIEEEPTAKLALGESETLHGTLLEALSDGVFVAQDGRFAFVNAALCEMLGYVPVELKDSAFEAIIAPVSLSAWRERLNARGGDAPPSHSAIQLMHKAKAEPLEAELSARHMQFRGRAAVLGVLRDVTARKQAEQSLRLMQENLAVAVDAAKMGTWDLDFAKDRFEHRSLRHDQIFGYETLQPEWGMDIARRHILEEDRQIFDAAFARARETGELDFEARIRRPDGDIRWMAARGRICFDERGEPLRAAGVNFDITERKRAEERQAFLLKLSDALRPLADPVAIQGEASRLLGEYLGVSRALYFEVEAGGDSDLHVVRRDYCAPGAPSLAGRYRAEKFGMLVATELRAGHTLSFTDTAADPLLSDAERKAYVDGGVRASVAVPLVKAGRHIAAFVVHRNEPHAWTAEEYALITETAERTWAAVERARAESALRQSEEKLRSLFDSIDEGFFIAEMICDNDEKAIDFRFLEANPALERMIGLSGVVGERARAIMPDLAQEWIEPLARAASTGEPLRFERGSAALRRCFSAYAARFGEMGGVSVAVVLDDITERKRAEERLRQSERRFRQVVQSLPQMVWTCEPEGQCDYLSPQWVAYTGAPEAPQLGFGWLEQIHPDDRDRTEAGWRSTVERGGDFVIEHRIRRCDGVYRWFHTLAVPLRDEAGRIVKWFGSNTDITESKNAEETLRDSDRRKDEFLATLAHELRNPLAPIHNAVHVLRKTHNASARDRALLDMMERQVSHLVRLVDDLIQISRVSRGKIRLHTEHINLASVLRGAVETSGPLIEQKSHAIEMRLPHEPLPVLGDPVRLTQAFTNLVNNAAKYTPRGGRIEIEAERSDGDVIVRVRDNGLGVSEEMLPHIFDLFAQFHSRAAHCEGGLGIGLALVRSLVELHGGRVEAQSAGLGRGSDFIVRLPVDATALVAAQPNKIAPAADPALKVLVIDDDRDVADSLRMLLETFDVSVLVAYDGHTGLEAVSDFEPDLAFIDIGMPGMDGLETARRIRAARDGRGPKLIALTGWGQDEDRAKTREAGFDLHLTKPASIEALGDLLSRQASP